MQDAEGARRLFGADDEDEPHAAVERAAHLALVDVPAALDEIEDRRARPRRVDPDAEPLRQDAREVPGDAAAGDVAHRAHRHLGDHRLHVPRVEPRRREERLADRFPAEGVGAILVPELHRLHEHLARERIAVRVEAARREADHDVSGLHLRAVDDLLPPDDADGEPREVVLPRRVHPRQLRGLPAEERALRLLAGVGDPADDRLGDAQLELPGAEVVEEEERAGAAGDDVVHAHADEIEADRVVRAGGEGHLELRPHAVGAAHQDGLLHVGRDAAQPGEAADVAHDLRDARHLRQRLDALDELVARVDVDPRVPVGDAHAGRT